MNIGHHPINHSRRLCGLLPAAAKARFWGCAPSQQQAANQKQVTRARFHLPFSRRPKLHLLLQPAHKRAVRVSTKGSFRFAQVKSFRGINPCCAAVYSTVS